MSATVRLGKYSEIQLNPIHCTTITLTAGVLLTVADARDPLLNCCLIPLDRIGAVIESLRLVASQVHP